jgi:hypothetical protein
MFTWLDLIAPIGTAVVAAVLCTLGVIKAKKLPPKIISAATGIVFLASIPAWYLIRSSGLKPDYTTSSGVEVKNGKHDQCSKDKVEANIKWLSTFWSKHYTSFNQPLKGVLLVCLDEEKLTTFGRLVRGYSFGKYAVVGWNGKQSYTDSLVKHELSHFLVGRVDTKRPFDEAVHHAYFKEVKLGH